MIANPSPRTKPDSLPTPPLVGRIAFTKMHGLGNDFIVISEEEISELEAERRDVEDLPGLLAGILCDRHHGVGADGLIVVRKSDNCDLGWSYRNSDGSASYMCGNGLRCLALWAVEKKLVANKEFCVETGAQKVTLVFRSRDEIKVDMGEPVLESNLIPVQGINGEQLIARTISEGGRDFTVSCVNMGNPHCVLFASGIPENRQEEAAGLLQEGSFFPEGVNVEFVEVESKDRAIVRVFERGAGFTLACASGAAAVVVAGYLEGRMDRHATVMLPGGQLEVEWKESSNRVFITGPAREIYNGRIDLSAVCTGGGR